MGQQWIKWDGGECPLQENERVHVKFRDADGGPLPSRAGALRWSHYVTGPDSSGDIVAYSIFDDGWIERGTLLGIPVNPKTTVFVRFAAGLSTGPMQADEVNWTNVVAYKVVKPTFVPASAPIERALAAVGDETLAAAAVENCKENIVGAGIPLEYPETPWSREQSGRNESMSDAITSAPALLDRAMKHMEARATTYDSPAGERYMATTVGAFNAVTGRDLRESEGWLLMVLLKLVRSEQRQQPHADSVEDGVAYSALYGESRMRGA